MKCSNWKNLAQGKILKIIADIIKISSRFGEGL
jgi:hypothetical protein